MKQILQILLLLLVCSVAWGQNGRVHRLPDVDTEVYDSAFSGLPNNKSQALDTLSKMQSINSVSSLITQANRFKEGQRIVIQETGAIYNVVSSTVATVDNYSVIQNSNGDYLELQRETANDPKFFGATPNDDTEDTPYFNRMIAFQKAKYNAVDIEIPLGDTFLVNMLLVDSIAEFKLHGGGVLKLPAKEYGLDSVTIITLNYIPVININNIHFDGSKSDAGFVYDRVMPTLTYLNRNNLIQVTYNETGAQNGNSKLVISDFTIKDAFQNCIRISSASDPYLTAKGYSNIVVERFSLINCGGITSRGNPVNFIVRDGYQEADTSSYFIYGSGVLDAEATANSINHTAEAVLTTPITNVLIENIVFKNGEHGIFLQNPNHFTLKNIKSINRGYVVLADTLAPRDTFLVNEHGVNYPGGYIVKVDHVYYKEGRTAYVTGLFQENPEPQGLNGSFNFVECDYNVIVSDFKANRRFHIRKEDPGQGVSPKQFKVSDGFFFGDNLVGAFNNSVAPGSVFDNVSFVPIINDTLGNDYELYKIGLGNAQTLQPSRDVKFVNCDFINAGFNIVNTVDSIQWVDCRFYNEKGIQFNHNQDRFQKGFIIDGCENVRLRQYRFADTTGISGSELTFDPLDSLELTIRNSSLYAWGATSASLTNASELGLYTNSPYIRMQDVTLVDQNYNTIGNIDDRNSTYWPIRRTNSSFEIRPELGVYSELSTGVQTITLDTALLYNPEREVIIKDIAGNLDETNYIQVVAESGVISGPGVVNDTIFMRIPYQWIKLKNTDSNWLIVDGNNSFEKLSINDDGATYNAITTGKTLNQSTVTIKSDANNSSNSAFRVVNSSNSVLMDIASDGRFAVQSGSRVLGFESGSLSVTNGISIQPLTLTANDVTAQFSTFKGETGSATNPTWSWQADTNSGLFSKGPDSAGLSLGGVERIAYFTDRIRFNGYGAGNKKDSDLSVTESMPAAFATDGTLIEGSFYRNFIPIPYNAVDTIVVDTINTSFAITPDIDATDLKEVTYTTDAQVTGDLTIRLLYRDISAGTYTPIGSGMITTGNNQVTVTGLTQTVTSGDFIYTEVTASAGGGPGTTPANGLHVNLKFQ